MMTGKFSASGASRKCSSILRAPDEDARRRELAHFVEDLTVLGRALAAAKQAPGAEFELDTVEHRSFAEARQAGVVEFMRGEIVSNLQQRHAERARLAEQAELVQGMRRRVAFHTDRPAEGVAAEAETDMGGR